MLPKLPLNQSTFSKIRKSEYLYVDKTEYAYKLITQGPRYFLSRPRRFGKSLFVSTLDEILQGNKELFEGLWISKSDYGWHKHAVVSLDFSELTPETIESFKASLIYGFVENAKRYGIILDTSSGFVGIIFKDLITALYEKYGRVAVLIDEYDRPLLHTMHKPELAGALREIIQNFFTTIKARDKYIDFVFITGVTSFTKAGLFSGINNLTTVTLQDQYAAICGYTDAEIDIYFKPFIQKWADASSISYDELRSQIKVWYNGYHFGETFVAVYNPYSLMNALTEEKLKDFWIQSGTPAFLIECLKKEYSEEGSIMIDPEALEVTESLLQAFDIGNIPLPALMFQAGYLTITGYDPEYRLYSLGYPNQEVETAFKGYLLKLFTDVDVASVTQIAKRLKNALIVQDIAEFVLVLKHLFSRVTYYEHRATESFYHTVLQTIFTLSGIDAQSQVATSHGRIDMVLTLQNVLYIIEIKVNESAQKALDQIVDMRYADAYMNQHKLIILVGLSFTRKPKEFDIQAISAIVRR